MASTVNPLLQSVELARDKFNHSIQVLSPALNSTTVVSVSGASASGSLPTGTSIIRFASTANCHVVFGIGSAPTATTSDWLFPAGVEVFTVPSGATHFAVIGAGGSGTTVINKIAAGISTAISGTVVLGSKLIQGMISSAKAVAISTTVFIYDPSATPTIFQRMNFLRRFIGRR